MHDTCGHVTQIIHDLGAENEELKEELQQGTGKQAAADKGTSTEAARCVCITFLQ